MPEILFLLKWPILASLLLPWLLVYLGLHIVQRGVIFVDLALAQVAAFGTATAMLLGYDVHDWQSFAFSMGFTLFGAAVLSLTRSPNERVPQEALIGIVYVVAAAAAILALSKSTGGREELQRSLVGELLVVPPTEVLKTFVLFLVVGGVHFFFRRHFFVISESYHREGPIGRGAFWWDFLFYMLFGVVVTSFVHIGGVLLVFSYLVIPAVCAAYLTRNRTAQFLIGWGIATAGSLLGLGVTVKADLPIGAAIVCVLGGVLLVLTIGLVAMPRRKRANSIAREKALEV